MRLRLRLFIRVALLPLLVLPAIAAAEPLPNIVIILADDLGWGDVSCQGAKLIRTPRIDTLAREGMRFTHGYAPASVCSPTRYGILTGRFCWRTPLQRGTLGLDAPLHIERGRMTLASLLKANGYRTAAIGKWHLGYGEPPRLDWSRPIAPGPLEVGFDEHFGVPSNHNDLSRVYVSGHAVHGLKPGATFVPIPGGGLPPTVAEPRIDDLVNETLTARAVAFIEANRARPFFLYFNPTIPHGYLTPAPKYRGTSGAGIYGDCIQELDAHVGAILDALERHDLGRRTLLIFSSDNGGSLSDTGSEADGAVEGLNLSEDKEGWVAARYRQAKADAQAAGHRMNGPFRGGKSNRSAPTVGIYEGGFRVPFIIRWPNRVPANTTSDAVVCLSDLLATVAGLVGTKLPADAGEDSYDIGPVLLGNDTSVAKREGLVLHAASGVFVLRQGPWRLIERREVDGRVAPELYRIDEDVGETRNVQAEHPHVTARLLKLLDRYRRDGRSRPAS